MADEGTSDMVRLASMGYNCIASALWKSWGYTVLCGTLDFVTWKSSGNYRLRTYFSRSRAEFNERQTFSYSR